MEITNCSCDNGFTLLLTTFWVGVQNKQVHNTIRNNNNNGIHIVKKVFDMKNTRVKPPSVPSFLFFFFIVPSVKLVPTRVKSLNSRAFLVWKKIKRLRDSDLSANGGTDGRGKKKLQNRYPANLPRHVAHQYTVFDTTDWKTPRYSYN